MSEWMGIQLHGRLTAGCIRCDYPNGTFATNVSAEVPGFWRAVLMERVASTPQYDTIATGEVLMFHRRLVVCLALQFAV
jgi:hypothetical protein